MQSFANESSEQGRLSLYHRDALTLAPPLSKPFRAVLIEDDADLRRLVQLTLQFKAGWEVETAADGGAGLDLVRESRPDVVLVDFMMPEMDGFEVCRALLGHPSTQAIPRILFTARKNLDEAKLARAGLAGVIYKPFDLDTLADEIRALCDGRNRE